MKESEKGNFARKKKKKKQEKPKEYIAVGPKHRHPPPLPTASTFSTSLPHLDRLEVEDKVAEGRQVEETLDNGAEPAGLPHILQAHRPLRINKQSRTC